MKRVGVRELRNHLSRFLKDVASGEQLQVTDRGRVIAVLSPPEGILPEREQMYRRLLASGTITPPSGEQPTWFSRAAPVLGPGESASYLDEIRSDIDVP
jgi:prevent-host-death family protein